MPSKHVVNKKETVTIIKWSPKYNKLALTGVFGDEDKEKAQELIETQDKLKEKQLSGLISDEENNSDQWVPKNGPEIVKPPSTDKQEENDNSDQD